MSQITTVKSDIFGLYVAAGGWIARPFFTTVFKEGDKVKTHHFDGSTDAGVTLPDNPECNFRNGKYELWATTGTMSMEYNKVPQKKQRDSVKWYKKFTAHTTGLKAAILNPQFKTFVHSLNK